MEYIPGLKKDRQYYINPMFASLFKREIGDVKNKIDVHKAAPVVPEEFKSVHNGIVISWLRYPLFKNGYHILDVWCINKEEKLGNFIFMNKNNTGIMGEEND